MRKLWSRKKSTSWCTKYVHFNIRNIHNLLHTSYSLHNILHTHFPPFAGLCFQRRHKPQTPVSLKYRRLISQTLKKVNPQPMTTISMEYSSPTSQVQLLSSQHVSCQSQYHTPTLWELMSKSAARASQQSNFCPVHWVSGNRDSSLAKDYFYQGKRKSSLHLLQVLS